MEAVTATTAPVGHSDHVKCKVPQASCIDQVSGYAYAVRGLCCCCCCLFVRTVERALLVCIRRFFNLQLRSSDRRGVQFQIGRGELRSGEALASDTALDCRRAIGSGALKSFGEIAPKTRSYCCLRHRDVGEHPHPRHICRPLSCLIPVRVRHPT